MFWTRGGERREFKASDCADIKEVALAREEILAAAAADEKAEAKIVFAGVELPMWTGENGSQYNERDFEKFSLDNKSVEIMNIMAKGVKLDQPTLIEGETDIGKSKALEYLAWLSNHHLIYQSFSGQTDVTELIGKYVPKTSPDMPAALKARMEKEIESFKKLLEPTVEREAGKRTRKKAEKGLTQKSKTLLQKIFNEERGPSREEMNEIAKNEGYDFGNLNWEWQDGTVPRSMEYNGGKGCWLYFDELGVGEPQVLVKLNRILATEGMRRLEITENGGREVDGGPHFKLFATTNPPGYAGRNPFEKDFLRRWHYSIAGKLSKEDRRTRLLAERTGKKPALTADHFFIGRKKENMIADFKESEFSREVGELLTDLEVEFTESAENLKKSVSVETGEQDVKFVDLSDDKRLWRYVQEFQQPDLVQTLREAISSYYLNKINPAKIISKSDGSDISFREELYNLFNELAAQLKTKEKIAELIKTYSAPEDETAAAEEWKTAAEMKLADMPNLTKEQIEEMKKLLGV